jgi:nucleotide-binding universal stress UspA family protein
MPDGKPGNGPRAIVVGVDGSKEAEAALRWGVDEARVRGLPVHVVHAWTIRPTGAEVLPFAAGSRACFTPELDFAAAERAADDVLERAIAAVAGETEGVEIVTRAVEGYAAEALIGSVGRDDLLVVGSRGLGALAGVFLGSVSAQCVRYAPCPVVVVHAARAATGPARPNATRQAAAKPSHARGCTSTAKRPISMQPAMRRRSRRR